MTQKAGTPPDGGVARLLIGIPFGILIALAIASMIGWLILGLPVAAYDPLKMPQFVLYYRGDARVVRAMAGGLIGGGLLLGGLIYTLWARGAPLHGAARASPVKTKLNATAFAAPPVSYLAASAGVS